MTHKAVEALPRVEGLHLYAQKPFSAPVFSEVKKRQKAEGAHRGKSHLKNFAAGVKKVYQYSYLRVLRRSCPSSESSISEICASLLIDTLY
jgi:hypothetical protein